jgi:hypothetical protein
MSTEPLLFPPEFTYLTVGFKIRLKEEAVFPEYKGSLFRGVLGKAMHDLSCREQRRNCEGCHGVITCPYANLFKPDLILKGLLITVPFVVSCSDEREFLNPGDTISLAITLFGDFIDYVDYFLASFHHAGQIGLGHKRAKFEILEIGTGGRPIFLEGRIIEGVGLDRQSLAGLRVPKRPVKRLRLRFLSPTSLHRNSCQIYAPRLEEIVDYIVYRIRRLNDTIWRVKDYRLDMACFDGRGFTVSRYRMDYSKIFKSKGLGNKVELSGFTGFMDVSGDLDRLLPLLRAGEILHIGARTSYGLGKYELKVLKSGSSSSSGSRELT